MKSTCLAVALALAVLPGCASVWPTAELGAAHDLGDPPRVHAWAFDPPEQGGELALVQAEVRQRLSAAGWLEAPVEQAELVVEATVTDGPPRWVVDSDPLLTGLELVALAAALANKEEAPEPADPVYVQEVPRTLRIRILNPYSGRIAYEGHATAHGRAPSPSGPPAPLTPGLARELLASFPGRSGRAWTAPLPAHPATSPAGPAPGSAATAPALPARVACLEAVPVVALRKARFWEVPDSKRRVAFRLDAVTAGCATHATRGLVHVALSDGRSGYLSVASVRYHPGP